MSKILNFYLELGTDHKGRDFDDLISLSNEEMESNHDFIQWLFPLNELSMHSKDAPILTEEDIETFKNDWQIKSNLKKAFVRYLRFLGFTLKEWESENQKFMEIEVDDPYYFLSRIKIWLNPNNHNFLRITRVLRCLNLVNEKELAEVFYALLEKICNGKYGHLISEETQDYWRKAMEING